jgi:hypothetical protein
LKGTTEQYRSVIFSLIDHLLLQLINRENSLASLCLTEHLQTKHCLLFAKPKFDYQES